MNMNAHIQRLLSLLLCTVITMAIGACGSGNNPNTTPIDPQARFISRTAPILVDDVQNFGFFAYADENDKTGPQYIRVRFNCNYGSNEFVVSVYVGYGGDTYSSGGGTGEFIAGPKNADGSRQSVIKMRYTENGTGLRRSVSLSTFQIEGREQIIPGQSAITSKSETLTISHLGRYGSRCN